MSDREVWAAVGAAGVVEFLKAELQRQDERTARCAAARPSASTARPVTPDRARAVVNGKSYAAASTAQA